MLPKLRMINFGLKKLITKFTCICYNTNLYQCDYNAITRVTECFFDVLLQELCKRIYVFGNQFHLEEFRNAQKVKNILQHTPLRTSEYNCVWEVWLWQYRNIFCHFQHDRVLSSSLIKIPFFRQQRLRIVIQMDYYKVQHNQHVACSFFACYNFVKVKCRRGCLFEVEKVQYQIYSLLLADITWVFCGNGGVAKL